VTARRVSIERLWWMMIKGLIIAFVVIGIFDYLLILGSDERRRR